MGHKGFGIDMMRRNGLPVPPAFCITTEVGAGYIAEHRATMNAVWDDVLDGIRGLEAATSRTFGRGPRPLLVSVRSGAAVSMPGMMDTVLDLGVNDVVEQALAAESSVAFARNTRRRFDRCYQHIVAATAPDDPFAARVGVDCATGQPATRPCPRRVSATGQPFRCRGGALPSPGAGPTWCASPLLTMLTTLRLGERA